MAAHGRSFYASRLLLGLTSSMVRGIIVSSLQELYIIWSKMDNVNAGGENEELQIWHHNFYIYPSNII